MRKRIKWHEKETKLIEKDNIMEWNARAAAIQMKTRQKWASSHKNKFVLLSIIFWFESLSDMPTVNIFFLSEFFFLSRVLLQNTRVLLTAVHICLFISCTHLFSFIISFWASSTKKCVPEKMIQKSNKIWCAMVHSHCKYGENKEKYKSTTTTTKINE